MIGSEKDQIRLADGRTTAVTGTRQATLRRVRGCHGHSGTRVALADVEPADRTVRRIQGLGGSAYGASADVSDRAAAEALANTPRARQAIPATATPATTTERA